MLTVQRGWAAEHEQHEHVHSPVSHIVLHCIVFYFNIDRHPLVLETKLKQNCAESEELQYVNMTYIKSNRPFRNSVSQHSGALDFRQMYHQQLLELNGTEHHQFIGWSVECIVANGQRIYNESHIRTKPFLLGFLELFHWDFIVFFLQLLQFSIFIDFISRVYRNFTGIRNLC